MTTTEPGGALPEPPLPPEPPQTPPPATPYGARPAPDAPRGAGGTGFFDWLRSLGTPRRPGWIGGVCAGIAWRIGVDPIIVRGVVVVLAVFGLPMLLLYAIAWALLPDTSGRIHVEELVRGRFEPVSVVIGILLVVSLITLGSWWIGGVRIGLPWPFGGWSPSYGLSGGVLVLLFLAGIAALVVWLIVRGSRRAGRESAAPFFAAAPASPYSGPPAAESAASAPADGPFGAGAAAFAAGATAHAAAAETPVQDAPPPAEPADSDGAPLDGAPLDGAPLDGAPDATPDAGSGEPVRPTGGDTAELAAWRAQHEAWKRERDEFKRAQADADRAARAQWSAENKARAQAFQAEAEAARRLRRASRPRTSLAFVVTALGVAILLAGVTAAWAASARVPVAQLPGVALLAAGGAFGLAMVVAGLARRRSGFLAFLAAGTLAVAVPLAWLPPGTSLYLYPSVSIGAGYGDHRYVQPFGSLFVDLYGYDPERPSTTTIEKLAGSTEVEVPPDSRVRIIATLGSGTLREWSGDSGELLRTVSPGPDGVSRAVVGSGTGVIAEIRITVTAGDVDVRTLAPSPEPVPTD